MRLVGCRKTGAGDCNGGAAGSGSGNEFAHNSIFRAHEGDISSNHKVQFYIQSFFDEYFLKKIVC